MGQQRGNPVGAVDDTAVLLSDDVVLSVGSWWDTKRNGKLPESRWSLPDEL